MAREAEAERAASSGLVPGPAAGGRARRHVAVLGRWPGGHLHEGRVTESLDRPGHRRRACASRSAAILGQNRQAGSMPAALRPSTFLDQETSPYGAPTGSEWHHAIVGVALQELG